MGQSVPRFINLQRTVSGTCLQSLVFGNFDLPGGQDRGTYRKPRFAGPPCPDGYNSRVILKRKDGAVSHHQRERRQIETNRGNDPIQAVRTQSSSFNTAWLRNGESLSILQRTGFAIISLLFTAVGLYLVRFAVMFARQRDFMTLIFGGCSVGFLIFGVLGLKNVLRFKRTD
jgi:hypothetical protein